MPVGERNSSACAGIGSRSARTVGNRLFVVANQHAQLHLVKTGKRVGDEIEILSGLDAGERVVVSGADQLTDGQPVEAK